MFGCTASTSAAPPGPLIRQPQRSSTARTWSRATASKLWSGGEPTAGASLSNHCASAYITYSRSHAYAGFAEDISGSENSYFENYMYTSRAMVNENGVIDSVNFYLTRGNPDGGSMRVESEVGSGSLFEVWLPLRFDEEPSGTSGGGETGRA